MKFEGQLEHVQHLIFNIVKQLVFEKYFVRGMNLSNKEKVQLKFSLVKGQNTVLNTILKFFFLKERRYYMMEEYRRHFHFTRIED